MSNPTFLFIPGAWHTPVYFDLVRAKLTEDGFESKVVVLPSVGGDFADTSTNPDVETISDALVSLLNQGQDVIIVAHSYGGVCGSAAVGKVHREQALLNQTSGKIIRLVYVAALLPLAGESQGAVWNAIPFDPAGETDFYNIEESFVVLNSRAEEALCHDIPEPEQAQWKKTTRKHALGSLFIPVEDPGWRYVPTTYIYTTLDRVFYFKSQKWLVQRIKDAGIQELGEPAFAGELGCFELEASHTPYLSKPGELVDILKKFVPPNQL